MLPVVEHPASRFGDLERWFEDFPTKWYAEVGPRLADWIVMGAKDLVDQQPIRSTNYPSVVNRDQQDLHIDHAFDVDVLVGIALGEPQCALEAMVSWAILQSAR